MVSRALWAGSARHSFRVLPPGWTLAGSNCRQWGRATVGAGLGKTQPTRWAEFLGARCISLQAKADFAHYSLGAVVLWPNNRGAVGLRALGALPGGQAWMAAGIAGFWSWLSTAGWMRPKAIRIAPRVCNPGNVYIAAKRFSPGPWAVSHRWAGRSRSVR